MNNPPMRMLILLAVFGTAGSLLLAAESTQTPKPAQPAATQSTTPAQPAATATDDAKSGAVATTQEPAKDASKNDKDASKGDKEAGNRSIAEQAEAALKAAAEADGSAKEPPKSTDKAATDEESQSPSVAGKGPSPQRFVPSEQVRADFDVSFPIDI